MPGKAVRDRLGHPLLGSPAEGIDPYLPQNGNIGYRVSRYELDLEYKVTANRLAGTATITATAMSGLDRFSLDMSGALKVDRVSVNGKRVAKFTHRAGKLVITLAAPIRSGAAFEVTVKYGGTPRPVRGPWGEVGWEELSEGALVASQPNGAASWFPCDDHPSSKAAYQISLTTDSPFYALANGRLLRKRAKAAQTTWVYEQVEPMATYLATIAVGPYVRIPVPSDAVPIHAVLPPRLRNEFAIDFGRQGQIMAAFVDMFGPYPFPEYTVVITGDPLEIPIEAQGISTFGANHCDGTRDSERLVAHELAHQWFGNSLTLSRWKDIWLHEGFACYAEWLWSERSGGPSADECARKHYDHLVDSCHTGTLADPGPDQMFDDWVYKRGALTLHAIRIRLGDTVFFTLLRDWCRDHRYSSITTDEFVDFVGHYSSESLRPLFTAWLFTAGLPDYPG